jgi:hypothetical protein
MVPYYIALTALTGQVRPDELGAVASALQTQVTRDFFPEWGVNAIIAATPFDAIPTGSVPIIVRDIPNDTAASGYHRTRDDDTPYIVVPYGPNWPLAASHTLLRMLANPSGSERDPGPSPMRGQATVEYLRDVCGPCQDISATYTINGVAVSDFCNRGFFTGAAAGSFTGSVRRAFEPAENGVVTWLSDDRLLYQARADTRGVIRMYGGFSAASRGRMLLGELVDALTPDRLRLLSETPLTTDHLEARQNARRAHLANMARFHDDIAWRFGTSPIDTDVTEPVRERRRLAPTAPLIRAEPAICGVGDPEMTARSPY